MLQTAEVTIGGKTISIETGHLAKQANGSVLVRSGGTVVICTATGALKPRADVDFFPLTVDYRERAYAAGKVPGGFFKREGKPSDKETLSARLIDRPIRPLFPSEYKCPTHIVSLVLSHDQKHDADILSVLGASCALTLSDIPWLGPVSPIRVGRVDGKFIANPDADEMSESDLNLTVVSSESSIVMVEGDAKELPEEVIVEALKFAFDHAQALNQLQRELAQRAGKAKRQLETIEVQWLNSEGETINPDEIFEQYQDEMLTALKTPDKLQLNTSLRELKEKIAAHFDLSPSGLQAAFNEKFSDLEKRVARSLILKERIRNDGRQLDEIRPIQCEVDVLPRVHGSAVFTRGQTQALVTLTLGTAEDEQRIDDLEGETYKSFMLHYNFPPFSVGEVGFLRAPGRREVGHGNLAERAIKPVIPEDQEFPYTIRVVSDILESNGSSSMATVCGATLSLMDGGVPIKSPVAGIAMGLVSENDDYAILSDISGLEDHLGDMDFKVAGTVKGITAIQMDIKLTEMRFNVLEEALAQAHKGRAYILDVMSSVISKPRDSLKPHAPRIHLMQINPEKIAAVIGPGGKVIRALTAETETKIELDDSGTIRISSSDLGNLEKAIKRIKELTEEATVGKDYEGIVKRVENYGAFIEILPGTEGLLHISRMANYRVNEVRDIMKEGDKVLVRVVEIDRMGKVKLSRKELISEGKIKDDAPRRNEDHFHRKDRPYRSYRDRDNRDHKQRRSHHHRQRPRNNDY